jgi:hypothetical protein
MGLEEIALVGLALSAAGTGAEVYSADATQRRENKAAEQELARQKGYRKEAIKTFEQNLGQSSPAVQQQQQDLGAQRLLQAASQTNKATATATPTSVAGGPSEMVQKEAAGLGQQHTQQLATYQGMDEFMLRQWINNLRTQNQLRVIADMARGSAGTLPLVLNQAAQSQAGTRVLGQGLGALGNVIGTYGATRPKKSAVPTYALPMLGTGGNLSEY